MRYIYDITINLEKEYIDFFEWNSTDKIININKIPLIKVNFKTFIDFLSHNIQLLEDSVSKINKGSSKFYLIMNDNNVLAVKFNQKGQIVLKSALSVTDELDIVENSRGINEVSLKYKILNYNEISFQTREEKRITNFLNREIKKLSIPVDNTKISYLYLECFGVKENDSYKALSIIKKNTKNNFESSKMYHIFKLIEQK